MLLTLNSTVSSGCSSLLPYLPYLSFPSPRKRNPQNFARNIREILGLSTVSGDSETVSLVSSRLEVVAVSSTTVAVLLVTSGVSILVSVVLVIRVTVTIRPGVSRNRNTRTSSRLVTEQQFLPPPPLPISVTASSSPVVGGTHSAPVILVASLGIPFVPMAASTPILTPSFASPVAPSPASPGVVLRLGILVVGGNTPAALPQMLPGLGFQLAGVVQLRSSPVSSVAVVLHGGVSGVAGVPRLRYRGEEDAGHQDDHAGFHLDGKRAPGCWAVGYLWVEDDWVAKRASWVYG